ncbi:MAG: hypothetical protein K8I30_18710 [Anaerolineae bacterium]|nr:hypothetical protein [Anaerolineae bacterium]
MKYTRRLLVLLVIAALMVAAFGVMAHAEGDAAEVPQITIEKSAEGYAVPAELPEGVVQIIFNNSAETPIEATFARLNEGITVDALMQALGEAGPMGALQLVALTGGASVEPGATSEMYVSFKPGSYILLDMGENAPPPSVFTVADAAGEGAAAPESDVQVALLDFAFSVPMQLTAGEQLWQIENQGAQWHEMVVFKVDDSTTLAELNSIVQQVSGGEEPSADVQPAGFVFPISHDETAWVNMNLEAGTYVAICFLPDFASGHAHFEHGMMQVLNVQ